MLNGRGRTVVRRCREYHSKDSAMSDSRSPQSGQRLTWKTEPPRSMMREVVSFRQVRHMPVVVER